MPNLLALASFVLCLSLTALADSNPVYEEIDLYTNKAADIITEPKFIHEGSDNESKQYSDEFEDNGSDMDLMMMTLENADQSGVVDGKASERVFRFVREKFEWV